MSTPADEPATTPDAWGAVAASYRWQEPLERRSTDALLAVLAPGRHERLLDLGAGVGHLVRRAAARGDDAERGPGSGPTAVVEASPRMVAAGRYAGAGVLRADATRLPVADGSLDVVTAAWLLHVLDPAERAATVAEAARVLRPGGRFGLVVPAAPRTPWQRALRRAARTAAASRGLRAFEVPEDLPGLLTDYGLQVRHHRRTGRGYLADVVVCTRAGTGG